MTYVQSQLLSQAFCTYCADRERLALLVLEGQANEGDLDHACAECRKEFARWEVLIDTLRSTKRPIPHDRRIDSEIGWIMLQTRLAGLRGEGTPDHTEIEVPPRPPKPAQTPHTHALIFYKAYDLASVDHDILMAITCADWQTVAHRVHALVRYVAECAEELSGISYLKYIGELICQEIGIKTPHLSE